MHRSHSWLRYIFVLLTGALSSTFAFHPNPCRAASQGDIKQAVTRAAGYLRDNISSFRSDKRVLAAYALYKAGDPATSPAIAGVLNEIVNKFPDGNYNPDIGNASMYEAGVTAMFLADVDPEKYRPQLQKIADYLIEAQLENGSWDYRFAAGDTSVTQYGCLGLWAAARVGIAIPDNAWDGVLAWHLNNQQEDGGFPYVPGSKSGPGNGGSTLNMSGAAVASSLIAAMHLYPTESKQTFGFSGNRSVTKTTKGSDQRFGVLERREPQDETEENGQAPSPFPTRTEEPYDVQSSFANARQVATKALNWVNGRFEVENSVGPKMYYYYTIERMAALTGVEELGGQDWFEVCSNLLVERQEANGSWTLDLHDREGPFPVGTSFGILFLTRSTAKLLNRLPRPQAIGGGLLAGGRGLPDDLKQVDLDHGDVKAREPSGPLDELLRDLARAGGDDIFEVQQKIVEKIQLGDRSELIGQTDRLVQLLDHPLPEIRKTAMWALGRSDDLKLVRYAIAAIVEDPDVDVLIEAHAALCWFSRRPDGFGLADNPVAALPPEATDDERRAAINQWRKDAVKAWGTWYLRVCPYEERDDPFVIKIARRVNSRR